MQSEQSSGRSNQETDYYWNIVLLCWLDAASLSVKNSISCLSGLNLAAVVSELLKMATELNV